MIRKVLDFAATEERARGMSDAALRYAIKDCSEAARGFDSVDREHGTDVAGYYRDELSVYARELAKRDGAV